MCCLFFVYFLIFIPVSICDFPFNIAMISINRKNNYIYETINSLFSSTKNIFQVHIFIGNLDLNYVKKLQENKRIIIHPMNLSTWNMIKKKNIHVQSMTNYVRTILWGHRKNKDILILEDDIIFKKEGLEYMQKIIDKIIQNQMKKKVFALDGYVSSLSITKDIGNEYIDERNKNYWCIQSIYYSKNVLNGLFSHLSNYTRNGWFPKLFITDNVIGQYLKANNIPMFSLKNTIVQHIGHITTGLQDRNLQHQHYSKRWNNNPFKFPE